MLSDGTIRRLVERHVISFQPEINEVQFQPASIDLRLGHQFRVLEGGDNGTTLYTLPRQIGPDQAIHSQVVMPGVPVLAHTLEHIHLPSNIVARVEGKSSWGRKFLMVHMTAGFIDPGFKGQITLEILNLGNDPIELYPGDMICQVSFETLDLPAERPYGHSSLGSRYQGQIGPVPARDRPVGVARTNLMGSGIMATNGLIGNDGITIE